MTSSSRPHLSALKNDPILNSSSPNCLHTTSEGIDNDPITLMTPRTRIKRANSLDAAESPVQRHVGFDAVSTRGSLARDEAAARSDADARFSQAMIDLATVVKLDSRILLKIVIAAPGDTALLEPAQLHVTKNAAKLVRLLLDKLDAEQSSERRVTLLNELFVDDCRLLKTRVVQVVRATVAASGDRQYVEVLRQSHAKLGELVDTIVSNVATYRQQLRRRSENVKAGVLRQTKRLVNALKELRTAVRGSRASLEAAARKVSEYLLFFLEIGEAAVLDEPAQLLRSAVADVLDAAKAVQKNRGTSSTSERSGNDDTDDDALNSTSASDSVPDEPLDKQLNSALDNAVTIIRQMVYNVLASVDDVHEPQTLQRSATANVNNKRYNSNNTSTRAHASHSTSSQHDNNVSGQWESDEELAALTHVDLLSVERDAAMQHPMTRSTSNKFRVERCTSRTSEQAVILEKNKTAIGFYCRHFLPPSNTTAAVAGGMHEHVNFIANVKDKKHGAFVIVSIRRHAELFQDGERPQHLAIVRTKESDELLYVPCSGTKDKDLAKALRDHVPALLKADLHAVRSENFVQELASFEEKNLLRSYKFGVLVLTSDNKEATESGLYDGRTMHAGLEQFLTCMARRVRLRGWQHYKGGLDVRFDSTGEYSWYTRFCGAEIMLHVAREIPYTEGDEQQVERKRHIGNDIVVLVFREAGAPPFNPDVIKSHFNHIFLVVTPVKSISDSPHYRIEMLTNDTLRAFGPAFKSEPIYQHSSAFGNMLLAKMVNGERAAYASPTFAQKLKRTRRELLALLCAEFGPKKK